VPDQCVFDLQEVLAYAAPKMLPEGPDGAFGTNTAAALEHVTGKKDFDPVRDIPLFTALLGKMMTDVFEDARQEREKMRLSGLLSGRAWQPMYVTPDPEHYNQADPRWAEEKMGVDLPMRRGGCGIACMAMLFQWMWKRGQKKPADFELTPVTVDRWMDENGGYASGTNLIVWKKMEDFCRHLLNEKVVYQQDGNKTAPLTHDEGMSRARQYLTQRNQPIILRVQNRQFNGGNWFNHFVLGVGIRDDGELDYLDPRGHWGGDRLDPRTNTGQTQVKGGYNVVGIEQYILRELIA